MRSIETLVLVKDQVDRGQLTLTVAVGTIPGHALYFLGYETSKKYLNKWMKKTDGTSPISHFVSGVVADVYGSVVWTPMDVIQQKLKVEIKTFKRDIKAGVQGVPRELSEWTSFNTILRGLLIL